MASGSITAVSSPSGRYVDWEVVKDLSDPGIKVSFAKTKTLSGNLSGAINTIIVDPASAGGNVVIEAYDDQIGDKCGTQATIKIDALQIQHECVATPPADQSRTNIGVGEKMMLWLPGSLSGTFTWKTSAGTLSRTNGTSTTLTAPDNAATATVTVSYAGGSCTTNFDVLAPDGSYTAVNTSTPGAAVNVAAAGMVNTIILGPTNVSLSSIRIQEIGENAENTQEYYQVNGAPKHTPSGQTLINFDNSFPDRATGGPADPPWSGTNYSGGSFDWQVPTVWWVPGGPTNQLWAGANNLQTFLLTSNGTLTVTKYGLSVTRTTNDDITMP